MDLELLDVDLAVGLDHSRDGGEGALGNDSDSGTLGVLLGQLSQLLGDLNNVVGAPGVALGVGASLRFIAEDVVGVGHDAVQLILKKLRDERCGEREHESLVVPTILSASFQVDRENGLGTCLLL